MRLVDADEYKKNLCGKCSGYCHRCDAKDCINCVDDNRCDFIKALDEMPSQVESR